MKKLLIIFVSGATTLLGGCFAPEKLPFIYRPDLQQGNVIEQEKVDQLRPGMPKRQVRFLMGSPTLIDVFHQDRWDYFYYLKTGGGDYEQKRLTLLFEGENLTRIEGDFMPDPERALRAEPRERVVTVPDYSGDEGFLGRTINALNPFD